MPAFWQQGCSDPRRELRKALGPPRPSHVPDQLPKTEAEGARARTAPGPSARRLAMARHVGRCGCFANPLGTNERARIHTAHVRKPQAQQGGPGWHRWGQRPQCEHWNVSPRGGGSRQAHGSSPGVGSKAQIQGCAENAGTPRGQGSYSPTAGAAAKGRKCSG